jgi:multicomponent Na+:H+ antiporter subunit E
MSAKGFVAALLLWLVLLPSAAIGDLLLGTGTAVAAAWTSARLAARDAARLRLPALFAYAPHFLWQSVRAAFDVALRAFSPDMRLHPGHVDHATALPRGLARNTFATITSLMPGSVPFADRAHALTYHCLDTTQPVAAQLAAEEAALGDALGGGGRDG